MSLIAAWTVGNHRVEVRGDGTQVRVMVDDVDQQLPIHARWLGEWPLHVGKRDVQLVRVRNLDVARSELWISGVRVPPSEIRIPRRKATEGSTCERHVDTGGGAYRSASAPAARITCGVCGLALCRQCIAVDGVRCAVCFEAATRTMEKRQRELRVMAPAFGAALGVLMVLAGLAARVPKVATAGAGLVGLTVFLVARGLWRERVEARERIERRAAYHEAAGD